jgi:hypothetical protein
MPCFLALAFCSDPYSDTREAQTQRVSAAGLQNSSPFHLRRDPAKWCVCLIFYLHFVVTGIGFQSGHFRGHMFLLLYFVAHQCSFDFCFAFLCPEDSAATPNQNPGNYSLQFSCMDMGAYPKVTANGDSPKSRDSDLGKKINGIGF